MPAPERIFVLGLMGAGKTAGGVPLAARLRWPYVDNDLALAAGTGRPLGDLRDLGPGELHHLEALQLRLTVAAPVPLVASVAASAADDPDLMALLAGAGRSVYLRADPPTLAARVGGTARPWIAGGALAAMTAMVEARDPVLVAAADLVLDAARPAAELVQTVVDWLGRG